MSNWQPIETAPKGQPIIAWVDWLDEPGVEIGIFQPYGFVPQHRTYVGKTPTFWMPLPEPPK